jgi:hypothetical protein
VKVGVLGALAVGYVLGTRAGRERYEQIRRLASEAADHLEAYGARGTLATWAEKGSTAAGIGTGRR